ncbi:MAG TPA: hypothetical protein VF611_00680 [Pyrinomonadaceae bacterium]|jgi:hypothetical protein
MSSAVGKGLVEINETDFVDAAGALEKWEHWPASTISHHGEACCEIAREWVFSTDFAQLGGASLLTGPRWVRHRYPWGPSRWPIHWCEAVRQKSLDCGALAALSHEVFRARGLKSFPAQFIQQFTEDATRDWQSRWAEKQTPSEWIREDLIYHEGCAVATAGQELKVWDSTAAWWVNTKQFGGYHGVLALRIFDAQAGPDTVYRWGAHTVVPNVWQKIERARGDFA